MGRYDILLTDQREKEPKGPKATTPQSPADEDHTTPAQSQEPGNLGSQDPRQSAPELEAQTEGRSPEPKNLARKGRPIFDINQRPYKKYTFLCTDDEYDAAEDLKRDLRRVYDLEATKENIGRCGLQHLLEDYYKNGEDSIVIKLLKKRWLDKLSYVSKIPK